MSFSLTPKNESWLSSNKKAFGIVRVSSHKQGDGSSPDVQKAGIEFYAESLGLSLSGVAVIEESAKYSSTRKKYHEAIKTARKSGARHLVFWVWDRIARNYTDVEDLEQDIRRDVFVLHLANERRVLHCGSTPSEWLTAYLNALTSKQYSVELARRATESTVAKAQSGWAPFKAPLGYRNVKPRTEDGGFKDRGGTIELTSWGKRLVRRMGELRIQGFSFEKIAVALLDEGLVPPRWEKAFRGNGAHRKVEETLKHPFYKGEFYWRETLYKGKHETVFTEREWEEIQQVGKKPAHIQRKRDAALAGWLLCAECGCRITYDPKTKKSGIVYHYYRCANGKGVHPRLSYATEGEILEKFEGALDAIRLSPEKAREIADYLSETHEKAAGEGKRELARAERELDALSCKEDEFYDDFKRGLLDEAAYKRRIERIKAERRRLEEAVSSNTRDDGAYLVTAQKILELATKAKTLWNSRSPRDKRELLEKLLSNPRWDSATARYDLRKPFQVLAEMRQSENWRARRESNPQPTA
ncbi:MAG: recombinase family protein [Bdellovibrionota bacterium]